jgi:hypothetical protein
MGANAPPRLIGASQRPAGVVTATREPARATSQRVNSVRRSHESFGAVPLGHMGVQVPRDTLSDTNPLCPMTPVLRLTPLRRA